LGQATVSIENKFEDCPFILFSVYIRSRIVLPALCAIATLPLGRFNSPGRNGRLRRAQALKPAHRKIANRGIALPEK